MAISTILHNTEHPVLRQKSAKEKVSIVVRGNEQNELITILHYDVQTENPDTFEISNSLAPLTVFIFRKRQP